MERIGAMGGWREAKSSKMSILRQLRAMIAEMRAIPPPEGHGGRECGRWVPLGLSASSRHMAALPEQQPV